MSDVIPFDPAARREQAKDMAVRVLDFIGQDEERLRRFLKAIRMTADQLRGASRLPHFHGGVLDQALRDPLTAIELGRAGFGQDDLQAAQIALAPDEAQPQPKKAKGKARRMELPELPRQQLFVDQ